jgi:membrane associated rhomboid family serine protease
MGIHDRDYYRDDTSGMSPRISVTTLLIVLHVSLFFLLALGVDKFGRNPILQWGAFDLAAIEHGEIWRLFTSHLIPSRDLPTIIIGMLLLYWAGRPLEDRFGPKRFVLFYLSAGLLAGLAKLALCWAGLSPHPSAIGLAAPLFAVLVLYAFQEPRTIVMLFFVLPVQVGHLVMVLVGLYLFSCILSFANNGELQDAPSVLAAAAFAAFFHYHGAEWLSGVSQSRPKQSRGRRLKLYDSDDAEPETAQPSAKPAPRPSSVDEHLEAKLDEVLEKLAKFGPDQLTGEEQQVLMKASEAYQRLRK